MQFIGFVVVLSLVFGVCYGCAFYLIRRVMSIRDMKVWKRENGLKLYNGNFSVPPSE